MVLLPGVIDSKINLVEHPEVVAQRIEQAVAAVGDRERVIATSDCGFGTFAGWEWVAEDVVWLKLKTMREGADIATKRLLGKEDGGLALSGDSVAFWQGTMPLARRQLSAGS